MESPLTSQQSGRRRRRRRAGENSFTRSREGHQEEHWGEEIGKKKREHFRLLQLNMGTMPEHANSEEFRTLTGQLDRFQVDCVTGQELNRNWGKMREEDRLFERFRGAFEAVHINESRYRNDMFAVGSKQYGGTAVFSINSAAHRLHTEQPKDNDPLELGRWTSTRLIGKRGKGIRVVSAYRPNKNNDTGDLSVYNQHLAKLAELNDDRDPLQAFLDDLHEAITRWNDKGDVIILGIDYNGMSVTN